MKWEDALADELAYWRWTLEDYEHRELHGRDDPARPFDPRAEALIDVPAGSVVSVLDVGSGPLSSLGRVSSKYAIEVTAVDPLADEYAVLLDAHGIGVLSPLRPVKGEAESLTSTFPGRRFDLVTCFNALDHSRNPFAALAEMVQMTKPTGRVYCWCWQNEGTRRNWQGLHRWNVDLDDAGKPVFLYKPEPKTAIIPAWFCPASWIECAWIDRSTINPSVHMVLRRG